MNKLNSTTERDIVVELTNSKAFIRWPCSVCGGGTERVSALAEVLSGEYEGFRVCETCLKAGDIDMRLARRAAHLEQWIKEEVEEVKEEVKALRALIGRLRVPSYAEWRAYEERLGITMYAAHRMGGTDGDINAETDKIMQDEATYQVWRQRAEQEERESRAAYENNRQSSSLDDNDGECEFDDDIPFNPPY
jgi:hypothetical protein